MCAAIPRLCLIKTDESFCRGVRNWGLRTSLSGSSAAQTLPCPLSFQLLFPDLSRHDLLDLDKVCEPRYFSNLTCMMAHPR